MIAIANAIRFKNGLCTHCYDCDSYPPQRKHRNHNRKRKHAINLRCEGTLSCVQTERKRTRKRKFSLSICSLFFNLFCMFFHFFSFAPAIARCEYTPRLIIIIILFFAVNKRKRNVVTAERHANERSDVTF